MDKQEKNENVWLEEKPVYKTKPLIYTGYSGHQEHYQTNKKTILENFSILKQALLSTVDKNGVTDDFNRYLKKENDNSVPCIMAHYQLVFDFDNGFGASVIQGNYSFGGDKGLFEIGFLKDGKLIELDGDSVRGHCSVEDIKQYLIE